MINKENFFISTEDMSLEQHQTTLSEYDGDHPTKFPHIGTLVVGMQALQIKEPSLTDKENNALRSNRRRKINDIIGHDDDREKYQLHTKPDAAETKKSKLITVLESHDIVDPTKLRSSLKTVAVPVRSTEFSKLEVTSSDPLLQSQDLNKFVPVEESSITAAIINPTINTTKKNMFSFFLLVSTIVNY
jgi:hypothetical protein